MEVEVSVIIPTRNGASRIRPTIDSVLLAVEATEIAIEVVIVDNGSSDGTADLVNELFRGQLRIVTVHERGLSNARNGGVQQSRGRVVLFLDDDVRVPLNWVRAMAEPILDGEAEITCGAVHLAPHLLRSDLTSYHRGLLADTCEGLGVPPRTVFGASMGASRRVFDAGIWFHPSLGAGQSGFMEEHVWFLHAVEKSFRATWVDTAPVEHHVSADRLRRSAWLRRAAAQGRSEALGATMLGERFAQRVTAITAARASARRLWYWFADATSSVPSKQYLEAVRAQHLEVSGLRRRWRLR
jgi:glycosyltransferase involved in cell wall biosynthesis